MKTLTTNAWAMRSIVELYKKADLTNTETVETTDSNSDKLDPALAQYTWMLDGLAILTGKNIDDLFIKEFTVFILQNKSKIDKATSNNGFASWLGKGKDGVVALLSSGFAFKMFFDATSYNDAKAAVERLHKDPEVAKTEAMIYDVGILGTFFGKPVYFYVMEKMKPVVELDPMVRENLGNIAKAVILEIQDFKKEWEELKSNFSDKAGRQNAIKIIAQKVRDITSSIQRNNADEVNYFNNNADLRLKSTWLPSFVEEIIMKFLTNRTDVHFGNIGITNFGEFRYYDPSNGNAIDRIMSTVINRKGPEDETLRV